MGDVPTPPAGEGELGASRPAEAARRGGSRLPGTLQVGALGSGPGSALAVAWKRSNAGALGQHGCIPVTQIYMLKPHLQCEGLLEMNRSRGRPPMTKLVPYNERTRRGQVLCQRSEGGPLPPRSRLDSAGALTLDLQPLRGEIQAAHQPSGLGRSAAAARGAKDTRWPFRITRLSAVS